VFTLSLQRKTTDVGMLVTGTEPGGQMLLVTIILMLAFFLLILAENGRLPIDNPGTHLELSMFSKAIHLQYSGPHLAILEWAEAIRLTFYLTLFLNLFIPLKPLANTSFLSALALYLLKLLLMAALLAGWESAQFKLRLRKTKFPIWVSLALTIVATLYIVLVPGSK
jgi:formate hydrogenlyase subunit 4